MNQRDIEFGFWNIKRRKPLYLNFDDSRIEREKSIGMGFYNEQNKSKDLKEWYRKLEHLKNVEYLWTYHKLNQQTLEVIARMKNLKGLSIKWSTIKSIEPLTNMSNLRHLNLGLSTGIEDLSPILSLSNLITLESENLKKIQNWNIIRECVQLEGLGLNGGMYQTLRLDNIEFIKELINLKYLFLVNVGISDKSLQPIENLKELECLRLSNRWNTEQFQSLRDALPKLRYGNLMKNETSKRLITIFNRNKKSNNVE